MTKKVLELELEDCEKDEVIKALDKEAFYLGTRKKAGFFSKKITSYLFYDYLPPVKVDVADDSWVEPYFPTEAYEGITNIPHSRTKVTIEYSSKNKKGDIKEIREYLNNILN